MRYRIKLDDNKLKLNNGQEIGIDFSQVKNISWDENGKLVVYEVIHDGTDDFNECYLSEADDDLPEG